MGPLPAEASGQPASNRQVIAEAAFSIFSQHIGESLSPELAGAMAIQLSMVRITLNSSENIGDNLAGVSEAATILEVSKQRVHQLCHDDETFPELITRLAATPVWLRGDLVQYASTRNRTRGPKPI